MKTPVDFFRWYFVMIYTDQIFPSLTPSLNTNGKILSIYIEGIAVRIERIKKSQTMQ